MFSHTNSQRRHVRNSVIDIIYREINAQWHREQELTNWYSALLTSNRDFYISPSSVTHTVTLEHDQENYGSYFSFFSDFSAF